MEPSFPDTSGVFLLFAAGRRPGRAEIREFVAAQRLVCVTHDPESDLPLHLASVDGDPQADTGGRASTRQRDLVWMELLRDGLTFDLAGLAPGQPVPFVEPEHRFDCASLPGPARFEALELTPGSHLAGGARSMPVVRTMLALARDMVQHFDNLEMIVWPPSLSAIGRRFFESTTTAWIDGGPFPALGLTAFRETLDGALQSEGLDFWIGQELRIEPPLSAEKVSATRLGVRLINRLVIVGGIDAAERITAPDGTQLVLRLSRNGRFIRVARE